MQDHELIPHLFRTEYRKIVAVLCKRFGIEHVELAEDIASETFLIASETWGLKGLPTNPVAWLYTVSKNKAKDLLKHNAVFNQTVVPHLASEANPSSEIDIDLSSQNIEDSQLQMMFAICQPQIPVEAQIGLSLNLLCGFGAEEIADALLSDRDAIYKRLTRSKQKLRDEKVRIEFPPPSEIESRLDTVLRTLYLLFSEGYYSSSKNTTIRKDLCVEAMRLNLMLVDNAPTSTPSANALLALMCYHSSRFDARMSSNGEIVLYEDQDYSLWNQELIDKGNYYLNRSSTGDKISKYHIEAGIAYWHTQRTNQGEKWENVLRLYDRLLQIEYSPLAALNRTYALAKANGVHEAIVEAEKLALTDSHFYHTLLGELYRYLNPQRSRDHLLEALALAKSEPDKQMIRAKLDRMT